ncbi:MAG: acyl-CoA reductase-like NAD-dependent aldehyde dehydrogenase [Rhodothermales bacterium]
MTTRSIDVSLGRTHTRKTPHDDDPDHGCRSANQSNYGIQAGVYTNQFDHVKQAHAELEVGGVMINDVPGFRIDSMPYGGVKDSGLGREGLSMPWRI